MSKNLRKVEIVLGLISFLLIAVSIYLTFLYVPSEKTMGAVQRIFYFHVGAAVASYAAFALLFFGSLGVLATGKAIYDILASSAAELAAVLCTIVLVTGMIWGRFAWGVWFNWEPRLVTFLLLWLLVLAYNLLRAFGDPHRIVNHAAVLGIICTVSVPIMVLSIKYLPAIAQLHPEVEKQDLDPAMKLTFFFTMFSMLIFTSYLLVLRIRLGLLQSKGTLYGNA